MPFPILETAGLAANVFGSIMQNEEARKRFRAMKQAAKRLAVQQNINLGNARSAIEGARSAWENDPGQATLRSMWQKKLANPDVISPEELSFQKQSALSQAGSESAGAITSLREQQQRAGLGGSRMALGAEAGLRSQAFGKAAGISTGLDITAKKANQQARDQTLQDYAGFQSDQNATRSSYSMAIANLLGNRQYGEGDLLAQM